MTVYGPAPVPLKTVTFAGQVQAYVDPGQAVPTKVTTAICPTQIGLGATVKVAIGFGRTVKGIINGVPTHPLNVGVTV